MVGDITFVPKESSHRYPRIKIAGKWANSLVTEWSIEDFNWNLTQILVLIWMPIERKRGKNNVARLGDVIKSVMYLSTDRKEFECIYRASRDDHEKSWREFLLDCVSPRWLERSTLQCSFDA